MNLVRQSNSSHRINASRESHSQDASTGGTPFLNQATGFAVAQLHIQKTSENGDAEYHFPLFTLVEPGFRLSFLHFFFFTFFIFLILFKIVLKRLYLLVSTRLRGNPISYAIVKPESKNVQVSEANFMRCRKEGGDQVVTATTVNGVYYSCRKSILFTPLSLGTPFLVVLWPNSSRDSPLFCAMPSTFSLPVPRNWGACPSLAVLGPPIPHEALSPPSLHNTTGDLNRIIDRCLAPAYVVYDYYSHPHSDHSTHILIQPRGILVGLPSRPSFSRPSLPFPLLCFQPVIWSLLPRSAPTAVLDSFRSDIGDEVHGSCATTAENHISNSGFPLCIKTRLKDMPKRDNPTTPSPAHSHSPLKLPLHRQISGFVSEHNVVGGKVMMGDAVRKGVGMRREAQPLVPLPSGTCNSKGVCAISCYL